jgi:hypothetical protein
VFAPLARGLATSTVRPKTACLVFAASIAAFTADALAWNFETDDFEDSRQYIASHRVPGNGNRASDCQLPVWLGVCGP